MLWYTTFGKNHPEFTMENEKYAMGNYEWNKEGCNKIIEQHGKDVE